MNELSRFTSSVIAPVMTDAGFRRKGGRFELAGDDGLAVVNVKGGGTSDFEFFIRWGIFPPPLLDFYQETRPEKKLQALDGLVVGNLIAPRFAGLFPHDDDARGTTWLRSPGHEQEFDQIVAEELRDNAVPLWQRLLAEPRRMLTVVRDEPLVFHNMCQFMRYPIWLPFVIEVDTAEPRELLARFDEQPADARSELSDWLRARLVSRVGSAARRETNADHSGPGNSDASARRLAIDPWASIVVVNDDRYPVLLDAYREDLNDSQDLNFGWRVLSFSGTALAEKAVQLAPALAAQTAAPVLTAMVIDSTALLLTGADRDQHWEAVIPLPADPDMANAGLTGTSAAQALEAWAADAGLDADVDSLADIATMTHTDGFGAMSAFFALLKAFGLTPAT